MPTVLPKSVREKEALARQKRLLRVCIGVLVTIVLLSFLPSTSQKTEKTEKTENQTTSSGLLHQVSAQGCLGADGLPVPRQACGAAAQGMPLQEEENPLAEKRALQMSPPRIEGLDVDLSSENQNSRLLTLQNTSDAEISHLKLSFLKNPEHIFQISIRLCAETLQPDETCLLALQVKPEQAGAFSTTLLVESDHGMIHVPISGTAHATKPTGSIYSAGRNAQGQLGTGKTSPVQYVSLTAVFPEEESPRLYFQPRQNAEKRQFKQVAAGGDSSCALTPRGDLYCWGNNRFGQLGLGDDYREKDPNAPVFKRHPQTEQAEITSVGYDVPPSAQGDLAARLNDLAPAAGGDASRNQVGHFRRKRVGNVPEKVLNPHLVESAVAFTAVRMSDRHTCALSISGVAYCWGDNRFGQLGDGTQLTRFSPVQVKTEHLFREISPANDRTCAVTFGGELYCWGRIKYQNLIGETQYRFQPEPQKQVTALQFSSVSLAHDFGCGIERVSRRVYCWNLEGQAVARALGGEATKIEQRHRYYSTIIPRPILLLHQFASLSAGGHDICGVSMDHRLYCWGGVPDLVGDDALRPYEVPTTDPVMAVSVGGKGHHCVLSTQGRAECWGKYAENRLLDRLFSDRRTRIYAVETFQQIALGTDHLLVLTE